MSKIYEALLQAEKDRRADTIESGERHPLPAPPTTAPYPVNARDLSRQDAVRFAKDQDQPASAAFAPDAIRRAVWRPSLDQLPATEERGPGVEQFRSLRSRMYEFRDLNPLKSVLISSGLPREGKSFVAANLAIAAARHKSSRVLLIDGDMRRSTQHHLLGCTADPGLAEFLSGKASLKDVLQCAAPNADGTPLPPGLASLTFIGGGDGGDRAADLSGNPRFEELLAAASPLFDWIFVDSSPVNLVTDAVNLARACDAVLLVARGGVTKYETAQRAVAELRASNVLGFVLNAVPNPPRSGGYYGYDSYTGYDSPRKTKTAPVGMPSREPLRPDA